MGDVYDEFERELLDWRRRYARDPRGEMVRLFLLALEREQLVSVGYRETLIAQRLGALSVSEEAREVMRHALLWAWKDEEIHAIYIRGVLLRLGGPRLKARAFAQQLSGAVAGWAASVRQHLPWRQAPLSNALATALTTFGRLAGKVPRAVRTQLEYGPLRDFCLFQVDAERTAARCWERLAELAGEQPGVPALAGDFRRMKCDDDRHAQVFAVLGAALDGQDRLAEGETADSLAAKLAAAGEFFLPPERRRRAGSPVGRGGAVHVVRGGTAEEKRPLVRRLLQEAGLPESLQERPRDGPVLGEPHLEGGRLPDQLREDAEQSRGRRDPQRQQPRGAGPTPRPVLLRGAPGAPRHGHHDAARRVPPALRAHRRLRPGLGRPARDDGQSPAEGAAATLRRRGPDRPRHDR